MTRSKKIFFVAAGIFILLLIYVSYDIGKRTSFPGSKPQLKERLKEKYTPGDSIPTDTSTSNSQKN
jgi:hypothetical protein